MRCAARTLLLAAMAVATAPAPALADVHSFTVLATVLSKNNCRFSSAASILSLSIDPSSSTSATTSGTLSIRCTGPAALSVWSLSANSGLHGASSSALRLRHSTNPAEYLPYSLSLAASGTLPRNTWSSIPVFVAVQPADFQNAISGLYSDTVTLSLLP